MDVCIDCEENNCECCDDETVCECRYSNHTLAAAVLVKDAVEVLNPDWTTVNLPGSVETSFEGFADRSGFEVKINGRTYHVTVQSFER